MNVTGQPFSYAGDDPVNSTDPNGLAEVDFDPGEFGSGAGGGSGLAGIDDATEAAEHGGGEYNDEQIIEELNAQAIGSGQSFSSRAAARDALVGDAGAQANRFFKGATSKCSGFQILPVDEGYKLQFYAPANNAGYGKVYVQEIGSNGVVQDQYRLTIGPDNNVIERKP